jgi:NitT/TauT family transport system permease protein
VIRLLRSFLAPAMGLAAFVLTWELLVGAFDVRRFVLLAPSQIATELAANPSTYWTNALVTARHMLIGLAIALATALAVGSIMAARRVIEEAAQPVLVVILVTPWVAYITSVQIWLGFGDRTIYFLVAFAAFPVFAFGVVGGMRSADPAARELFASVDASAWEVWWRLRLPSALPSIFTTARFAIGLALAATFFAESKATTTAFDTSARGLGDLGQRSANLDRINGAETYWATIGCTALLGITGLVAVTIAERLLVRWHASQRY